MQNIVLESAVKSSGTHIYPPPPHLHFQIVGFAVCIKVYPDRAKFVPIDQDGIGFEIRVDDFAFLGEGNAA